jgi:hypothetical protein
MDMDNPRLDPGSKPGVFIVDSFHIRSSYIYILLYKNMGCDKHWGFEIINKVPALNGFKLL